MNEALPAGSFEWDEVKAASNLVKHGIDFNEARFVFDGRSAITTASVRQNEIRYRTIAEIVGTIIVTIWTYRGDSRRIISMRRARDAEKRAYRALHG
jgi:hypothetical protein